MPEAFVDKKLTERGLKIIEIIGRYRFIQTSSIIRLIGGNEDVTHRHLQHLYHADLISRLKLASQGNNAEFVYFLENSAVIRGLLNDKRVRSESFDFDQIRQNRTKYGSESAKSAGKHLFLEHELMISRFHAGIECGCAEQKGRMIVRRWWQGNETWDHVSVPRSKWCEPRALPVRPDAYFTLEFPGASPGQQRSHFFYEADRGTSNISRFNLKVLSYVHYFLKGEYLKKYGSRKVRAVLVETLSEGRAKEIIAGISEICAHYPIAGSLFWLKKGCGESRHDLDAVWTSMASKSFHSILD